MTAKSEALRPIARYKIGYHTDEWGMRSSTPSGIPDPAGAWVRYEDHIVAPQAQQAAPSAAVALSDDLRDRLVAISEAIADQDDRAAQAMLREILAAPQPSPTPQAAQVDAMADSQYLAGVSAGWNAANADNPNEALRKLHESRAGYLKPLSAARAPADSVTARAGGAVARLSDDIDAVGLARYKVVPAHESMFHRFAVVAGDGKQQLYLGRETECQNMARKFAGAFLDGAFYQSQLAASAGSVLEDAARWQALESCVLEINGGKDWMSIVLKDDAKPEPFLKGMLADKLAALAARLTPCPGQRQPE